MLDATQHARIIADIEHIASTANIPKGMLYKSSKEFCSGKELEWLTHFPGYLSEGRGLLLTGVHHPSAEMKMMAITAALIRNYIDARLVPLNSIIQAMESKDGEIPNPTVLLIPNLYIRQGGTALPAWKRQMVYDLLLSRLTAGRPTVLYVEDMAGLIQEYGMLMSQHLTTHYLSATE